jgi:CBS domain-containing protein
MKVMSLIKNKKVITIDESATLLELVSKFSQHKVGALVVSKDGIGFKGIVSERDVVREMHKNFNNLASIKVRDIMTTNVITCKENEQIAELMAIMTNQKFRHIPVVDDANNLISIISIGDIVKAYVDELENEKKALQDYITTG